MAVTYLTLYLPGSNQPVQVVEGSQLHFIYADMGASATPGAPPPARRPDPFPQYVHDDEVVDLIADAAVEATDPTVAALAGDEGSQTSASLRAASDARIPSAIARSVAKRLTGVKTVIIFRHDDIQRPALEFLPVYAGYGVKASWYQVTGYLDQPGQVTTAELRAIHAAGHEVGSHSVNHDYFETNADDPMFVPPTEAQRRAILAGSKAALEAVIGGDYVCETFAFPGNQSGPTVRQEVLDYYLLACTAAAYPTMLGEQRMDNHPQGYYSDLVDDASLAATISKTQAQITAWKAASDGTVAVIQAHNTTEMTAAQLDAVLSVLTADPEVAILTMREWAHYVRAYYRTRDGVIYYRGERTANNEVRWSSGLSSSSAYQADRRGAGGVAFRAKVNGTEVATLDDRLVMKTAAISSLENGHALSFYGVGNVGGFTKLVQNASGILQLITASTAGLLQVVGRLVAQGDNVALEVKNAAAVTTLTVNATRQTMRLANLSALPTGTSLVGEICLLNGVLNICTVAGSPGTWVAVGSQT